jgi:hypothetical protein
MEVTLRLTGRQHALLKAHLFPGDGNEAVAVALCGRRAGRMRHCLTVRRIATIPYDHCSIRTPDRVTWSTQSLAPLIEEAARRGLAVLKIHSHPDGLERFSEFDDQSDQDLFRSIHGWMDDDLPHASAVMLPDGRIFARTVGADGVFAPVPLVSVVGDDLHFWHAPGGEVEVPEFARRHAQAFGSGTTALLNRLSVAVVGCSGTGSPVVEQLARLGVGKLVLVDPDVVEEKNLNRILNAKIEDARLKSPKVEVMRRSIARIGLPTEVLTFARDLAHPEVVKAVAECDAVFGCMDSVDGRHLLSRLATFYLLPYFDVGVKLAADGRGGVDQICGTVHYLQPDGSSLLSRGTYTLEQVQAAALRRTDPAAYQDQLQSKYIVGVKEERPAVISVNMLFASLAVNEFLARLHPYRDDPNGEFAAYRISLTQARIIQDADGEPCPVLARHAGRGDVRPLLDMPALSEQEPVE